MFCFINFLTQFLEVPVKSMAVLSVDSVGSSVVFGAKVNGEAVPVRYLSVSAKVNVMLFRSPVAAYKAFIPVSL